jgi:Type I restriction modification DNA specificity domain
MRLQSLADLFDVDYGHSLSLNKLTVGEPSSAVAFVSRTAKNNGVAAWVEEIPSVEPLPAGLLTVCLRSRNYTLATFVQPRPFYTGFHIYVLTPKVDMSIQEKMWWATCIEANRYRYNFGRQANRTLSGLKIPASVPNWVKESMVPNFDSHHETGSLSIDISKWRPFVLGDLFNVKRGRNVLRRAMKDGSTPYISAVANNNGVAAWISEKPDYPAGCITLVSNGNGGMGYAFYQPRPFVASGDVTVLIPRGEVSAAACLFTSTVITQERYRWNFGRKWSTGRVRESAIKLPADLHGAPDWQWMHDYMHGLRLADAVLSPTANQQNILDAKEGMGGLVDEEPWTLY